MKQFQGFYSLSTTVFGILPILNASKAFASLPTVGRRVRGILETLWVVCGTRRRMQLGWSDDWWWWQRVNIKLNLHQTVISSVMTDALHPCKFTANTDLLKRQHLQKQVFPHNLQLSKAHANSRFVYGFQNIACSWLNYRIVQAASGRTQNHENTFTILETKPTQDAQICQQWNMQLLLPAAWSPARGPQLTVADAHYGQSPLVN
jgi:hypothetical protein